MKKLLFTGLIILFTDYAFSQSKDTLGIQAGFKISPQGEIALAAPGKGFDTTFFPLFVVVNVAKGKWFLSSYYSENKNAAGLVVAYQFFPFLGAYMDCNKKLCQKSGYTGIGCTTPLFNKMAFAFLEIGKVRNDEKVFLYVGAFIPLTVKLK